MISQVEALKLAVKALAYIQKRRYTSGEEAFKKGIDLQFAIDGHAHYTEYKEAIQHLESLQAVLEDPGIVVVTEQLELFEEV